MRNLLLILASLAFAGCQFDPHAHLYTTIEPKLEDIPGAYIPDSFHLPPDVGNARPDVRVELRADGTFTATNLPPMWSGARGTNFFASLASGSGNWEKAKLGTLNGSKPIWGVALGTPDDRFMSAILTGGKPPYGLIFTLGDPDSGEAILLKRKQ